MRNATPTQSVEKLLRALFEGTASDGPWVEHNGIAWEMEELACDESVDGPLAYQTALVTVQVVQKTAQHVLALLDAHEQAHPQITGKGKS
jgi:hypothetical protein